MIYIHPKSGQTQDVGKHERVKLEILARAGWQPAPAVETITPDSAGEAQGNENELGGDESTPNLLSESIAPAVEPQAGKSTKRSKK